MLTSLIDNLFQALSLSFSLYLSHLHTHTHTVMDCILTEIRFTIFYLSEYELCHDKHTHEEDKVDVGLFFNLVVLPP